MSLIIIGASSRRDVDVKGLGNVLNKKRSKHQNNAIKKCHQQETNFSISVLAKSH